MHGDAGNKAKGGESVGFGVGNNEEAGGQIARRTFPGTTTTAASGGLVQGGKPDAARVTRGGSRECFDIGRSDFVVSGQAVAR